MRFSPPGDVELFAVRDARTEQCDYEGGTGSDPSVHRIEWFLTRTAKPADAAVAAQAYNRPPLFVVVNGPGAASPDLRLEESLVSVQGGGIITALKPAERGSGVILRALLTPGPVLVQLPAAWSQRELICGDYRRKRAQVLYEAGWNQYDLPRVGDDVVVLASHTNEKDKPRGSPEVLENAMLYPFGGRLTWQAPDSTRCSGRRCPNREDASPEVRERVKPLALPLGEVMCAGVRFGEPCESFGQRSYLSTGTTGGSSCESSGPTILVCSGVPAPRVHCGAIL